MPAVNVKLSTFSLATHVLAKLEELCKLRHTPNKSRVVTLLIEEAHRKATQDKEEQYPT